jgi:Conserved TM helix
MMLAQVDIEGGLEEAWADVVTFAPKLLGFFVILLIGFFIAKALSRLANALLERVGFNALVERGTMRQAFERSKTDPSDVIGVVIFWLVFLVALQLAFGIWGPNPISDLLEGLITYLPNVIVAVVILVIAAVLAKALTDVLEPTLGGVRGGSVIAKGAGVAILIVGIFAALDQLQVAPNVVNGLFYALLVMVVGSAVVAFGVGGIPIARRYLERWTASAESTVKDVKDNADPEAGRRAAQQQMDEQRAATQPMPSTEGSM